MSLARQPAPDRRTRLARLMLAGTIAFAPTPVLAQRDSLRVNGESRFENEIESLARQLMQKRVTLMNLTRAVQELRLRRASAHDTLRSRVESSIRQMQARLASTESERSRLQKKLGDLCGAEMKPAGWMGLAFTGASRVWKDGNGPVIFRYLEYPSVESIESGSPAEKAGVQGGDLIMSFGGQDIRDRDLVFSDMLKPGRKLLLKVRRGAETKTLTLNIERRPDDFETPCPWLDESLAAAFAPVPMVYSFTTEDGARRAVLPPDAPIAVGVRPPTTPRPMIAPPAPAPAVPPGAPVPPTWPSFEGFSGSTSFVIAGARIAPLNADLAEALGAESGVLVLETARGSVAEQSGLRGGDVIVTADGRPLSSPMAFMRAIEQSSDREVRLQILHKKKQQTVVLRW